MYGLIESVSTGWGKSLVSGSFIAGIVCLIAFGFVEARARSPIVPPAFFSPAV